MKLAILSIVLLAVGLYLSERWKDQERTSLVILVARWIRKLARLLWALGEGLEIGYQHAVKTRAGISVYLKT